MQNTIRFRGTEHGVRTHGEQRDELAYQSESVIDPSGATASVRMTSDRSGFSRAVRFAKPEHLYVLQEIDAMRQAMAYRESPVSPIFKDERPSDFDDRIPPDGYQWCSFCLGIPEASAECAYCDGDGIERVKDEPCRG